MSNLNKLGRSPSTSDDRDAMHVAVASVVAAHVLMPGQRVGLDREGRAIPAVAPMIEESDYVGVVDPFLTRPVPSGAKFWLLVEPNVVTGLRHEWDHPAFAKR